MARADSPSTRVGEGVRRVAIGVFALLYGALLLGYAVGGRPFAHVGVEIAGIPLYVGEFVMITGLAIVLVRARTVIGVVRRSWTAWLLGLFVALGVLNTLPYLQEYGFDAVRDAALYYYAAFALIIIALVRSESAALRAPRVGTALLAVMVIATPFLFALTLGWTGPSAAPTFGLDGPLVFKPGDLAVLLALGLASTLSWSPGRSMTSRLYWPAFVIAWALATVAATYLLSGRAAILTLAISVGIGLLLWRSRRSLVAALTVATVALVVWHVQPPLPFQQEEVADKVTSSVDGTAQVLEAPPIDPQAEEFAEDYAELPAQEQQVLSRQLTAQWRLEWWRAIAQRVRAERMILHGDGFGLNLADSYGYQIAEGSEQDGTLRSPHNATMTVAARMGLLGMFVWGLFNAAFGLMVARGFFLARRDRETRWAGVFVMVGVFWTAAIINSSFDVYLESPQGGIWFWTLVGLGFAASDVFRRGRTKAPEQPTPAVTVPRTRPRAPAHTH